MNLHLRACCYCCCCEEPLKQTYISVCWGRRRNLRLCAKSSLEALFQIWEISRPKAIQALSSTGICTTGSTKPVGTYFGEYLCNQHLKQPGDIVSLSGIPQVFSLLRQLVKSRLGKNVCVPWGRRKPPSNSLYVLCQHLMKHCPLVSTQHVCFPSSFSPDSFTSYVSQFG